MTPPYIDEWPLPNGRTDAPPKDEYFVRKAGQQHVSHFSGVAFDAPIVRHRQELATFAKVMGIELASNQHKGNWKDDAPEEMLEELLYHAGKLALAIAHNDGRGIAEYAADCGNLAMMVADVAGALNEDLHTGKPVEYERDDLPWGDELDGLREQVREWARVLLKSTPREAQIRRALPDVDPPTDDVAIFEVDGNGFSMSSAASATPRASMANPRPIRRSLP